MPAMLVGSVTSSILYHSSVVSALLWGGRGEVIRSVESKRSEFSYMVFNGSHQCSGPPSFSALLSTPGIYMGSKGEDEEDIFTKVLD